MIIVHQDHFGALAGGWQVFYWFGQPMFASGNSAEGAAPPLFAQAPTAAVLLAQRPFRTSQRRPSALGQPRGRGRN